MRFALIYVLPYLVILSATYLRITTGSAGILSLFVIPACLVAIMFSSRCVAQDFYQVQQPAGRAVLIKGR